MPNYTSSSFYDPSREFSVMPFWFINDNLDESKLRQQIADFEEHGVYGFVIHPRIGLPLELGWMSPELLRYYRIILEEAAKRQMKVMLYDEGMYPSGSSCGQVVANNPEHQCRCIAKIELKPDEKTELKPGENLIAVINTDNHGRLAFVDRKVDSVIRGLHYIGEGPEETCPPAADLLNTDAVDSFINLVYERFYQEFKAYFGETIFGIFTDEPDLLGRCRESGIMPGTTGIIPIINNIIGYDFTPYLPTLWYDDQPNALRHRAAFHKAVNTRFETTWYARLSDWCTQHDTALTGHPATPDDLGPLRYFHIPGQDAVWREVLPDTPSALEGENSTQAKCSASAMIHNHRQRNLNEYCGAYGHEMTYDEMNWLSNWCFIRGVNMLVPHAFYYSVRGVRRDERPPAVGPNSPWWSQYRTYADSCRRLSWLNSDSLHVCSIAILVTNDHAPWKSARVCFENQFDFNYLEEWHLWEDADVSDDGINIAEMNYRILIVESDDSDMRSNPHLTRLEQAERLFHYRPGKEMELLTCLNKLVQRNFNFEPAISALRVREVVKDDRLYMIIFNEEEKTVSTTLTIPSHRIGLRHDLQTGAETEIKMPCQINITGHQVIILSYRFMT